jgi:hypothetical protein
LVGWVEAVKAAALLPCAKKKAPRFSLEALRGKRRIADGDYC